MTDTTRQRCKCGRFGVSHWVDGKCPRVDKRCTVDGCDRPCYGWDLCETHYARWKRHGDPLAGAREYDPRKRFWKFIQQDDNGCWNWTGQLTKGYGRYYKARGVRAIAHRYVFEALAGPIPDGLTLDHLCLNKRCVNPGHLEPVTTGENTRRATALITHCPQGHPYDEANTYRRREGGRMCRICLNEHSRARRRRLAEKAS